MSIEHKNCAVPMIPDETVDAEKSATASVEYWKVPFRLTKDGRRIWAHECGRKYFLIPAE